MKNLANLITTTRVLLTALVLVFLNSSLHLQRIAIITIPMVMILDLFDGMAARKVGTLSINGSIYDILADRMIEFGFFAFFASHHICSLWAALIIIWRGLILDTIRSIALRQGETAFGESSFHKKAWSKLFTVSRFSRGTYNTLKTIAFTLMALQLSQPYLHLAHIIQVLVWITVFWSILRAIPVIIGGIHLLKPTELQTNDHSL